MLSDDDAIRRLLRDEDTINRQLPDELKHHLALAAESGRFMVFLGRMEYRGDDGLKWYFHETDFPRDISLEETSTRLLGMVIEARRNQRQQESRNEVSDVVQQD